MASTAIACPGKNRRVCFPCDFVGVLDKGDGVHVICDRPPPGGEPLLSVPEELAYSFQSVEGRSIGLNRRLPRITQRDASRVAFGSFTRRTIELLHAGLFAGAACRNILRPDGALKRKLRGWPDTRQKRLPSRRWVISHHVNAPALSRTRTITTLGILQIRPMQHNLPGLT